MGHNTLQVHVMFYSVLKRSEIKIISKYTMMNKFPFYQGYGT